MNNDPFGQNLPPVNQANTPPAQPSGWAPTPASPAPSMAPPPASPPASNPFEATPPPVPPVSGPMSPMGNDQEIMEPAPNKSSVFLIIILIILIVAGGLFLASWKGWVNLGSISKLWKGTTKTTTIAPTPAPVTNVVNTNDAKRKEDLANLKAALKNYYTAKKSYPIAATGEKTNTPVALKVLVPDYIAAIPVDPLDPTYYYGYKSDGKTFELSAVLEDKTDPAGITVGSNFLYKVTDISAESAATTTTTTTSTPTTSTGDTTPVTIDSSSASSSTTGTGASASATAGN